MLQHVPQQTVAQQSAWSPPQQQPAPVPTLQLSNEESIRKLSKLLLQSLTAPPPILPIPASQATILDLTAMPSPPALTPRPYLLRSLGLPLPADHVEPQTGSHSPATPAEEPQSASQSLPGSTPRADPCEPAPPKRAATEGNIPVNMK
jgi:hypothetical protein